LASREELAGEDIKSVVHQPHHLILLVREELARFRQKLSVLCRKERVKLGPAALQLDLVPCRGHKLYWYQTTCTVIVSRADGEMGDRVHRGINHHAQDLPTVAFAAHDLASNREPRTVAHRLNLASSLIHA
jgi:hypothetical protein